ncbi:fatty acyl-CoA reductase [Marinobacter bohaiensis]|uniref:fatty acyl-CoA reductase n=1 Tax=Marinobacter bohaiensis TaxID=2201898 RepID=UPI000DAC0D8A|nr:fatty acyl-CoA reductase [Marinobacter bohaiensis]
MPYTVEPNGSLVLKAMRGKHVLITGTTGFLGKVVLEKLIRTVPDIGGIHLLIRGNRRYPNADERFMGEIASSSVFERLKMEDPDAFDLFIEEKIHCVTGEVTSPRFGLSEEAFQTLAGQLDVVINSAASVNFREELDKALQINAQCLHNIINLSRAGGDLPVVQVSTCYVNGMNPGQAGEAVVSPARGGIEQGADGYFDVDGLIHLLEDKIADVKARYSGQTLEKKLVELGIREANHYGWSDTYTFTKWMGEQILGRELPSSALTILRPSIIESALEEPAPGWIEGVKVADAIILAYAREKVVLFPGKRSGVIDVIPVDLVANSIILSVAEAMSEKPKHRVYQCCSGSGNPISLGEFIDHLMDEAKENYAAYDRLFYRQPRRPFMAINRKVFGAAMSGARLPLQVANRALKLMGSERELRALRNIDTTLSLATIFGFYTAPDYVFQNDKLLSLSERMGELDRNLFPVDARRIDWATYLRKIHLAGLNKYALGDRTLYRLRSRKQRKAA